MWDGDNILDAKIERHFYDTNYREIKEEKAEADANVFFANYFGISVDMAKLCRCSFKMFQPFLNISRIQTVLKDNLKYGLYEFHSPFWYDDLEHFFQLAHFCSSEEAIELEVETSSFQKDKWEEFQKFFTTYFGNSGEYILSDSFVDNVLIYLSNQFVKSIETKGIVIRKEEEVYTVYYFEYFNHKMKLEEKQATVDEVSFIIQKDPNNLFLSGINEFLGLERER